MSDLFADLGAFANPFGTPSQGEWNLARGIYTTKVSNKSMIFFYEKKDPSPTEHTAIDQITDSGGRRIVKYEYPYVDGQALSDLGRKGETFNMNIKFHGMNYQTKLNEFIDVLVNSNEQATITHPVRGAITVRYVTHEFLHRYDEWNAITIKVMFEEDNTGDIQKLNVAQASPDSALRSTLQNIVNAQSAISSAIFAVGALLNLPASIQAAMNARLNSLISQISGLMGQLGVTFSSNQTLNILAAQSQLLAGGVTELSSGKTTSATLPPVYQVGYDPVTQAAINSQLQSFVNANQITPQQAMFSANQARQAITAAISEVNTNFGNDGYEVIVQYRGLSNTLQQAVESSLAATQSLVKQYTVKTPMSLRQVASINGLTPDDQNRIEALNPYLPSVNYLPVGTVVAVPAA